MFELKEGMKVKNKFGNIHIFLELINGEYWFENRTCNLEDEIDWEETAKLNGIDLEYEKDKKLYIDSKTYKPSKMLIQDVNKKTLVYISYKEIEIDSLSKEEVLAYAVENI